MLKRRSFLGAMLASFTAPYAMSNGVARGSLMVPVPQKIWTPPTEIADCTMTIKEYMDKFVDGPAIRLYSGTPENPGTLLATVPLEMLKEQFVDYDTKLARRYGGTGYVQATGLAGAFKIVGLPGGGEISGQIGDSLFELNSRMLATGDQINMTHVDVLMKKHRVGGIRYSDEARKAMLDGALDV
jgi:hypothetical protein